MKQWFAFGAIALFSLALPFSALAGSKAAQQEVATAQAHALMSAGADSLKMTQAHLHHVINCLVGPNGTGFDAAAANPCKGMGDGALNDAGKNAKLYGLLERALAAAEVGVKATDLATAQKAAKKTAALLKTAQQT